MSLAAVHRIDSPTIAEQVVADIRGEISLGILLPGQVVSVRDIADAHNIRISTLRVLLERLESERLLNRHGDVFAVAPVDIDDVRAVSRLLNCVESPLVRRVCESRGQPDIDALSARLLDAAQLPWSLQADQLVTVLDGLCAPVATTTERRICGELRRASVRHIGLGLRAMQERYPSGPTIKQIYETQFARIASLLEHCRRRDAVAAVAAAHTFRAVALWVSEFSAAVKVPTPTRSWPA